MLTIAGVLVAVAIIVVLLTPGGQPRKDPQRAFTAQQRYTGFHRAGRQCEFSTPWFTRCTRTATHADHFFPHTKGGASSLRNLVAACATHNLRKGAKMPHPYTRLAIEYRRRNYFPKGTPVKAGEWYGR